MVVIHYTAMQAAEAAVDRLCDPAAEVSAHYVIAEDGRVFPLVSEDMRAWHAGAGQWGHVKDVNSHSIGIELANVGPDGACPEFPEAQMLVLERLLGDILRRRKMITPERVIGHSDMAPGRKVDPGPYFDWKRLADKGLSIWANYEHQSTDWTLFKEAAQVFGYRPPEQDDFGWQCVLEAFRLRFRSHIDLNAPLDGTDVGTLQKLADEWPCAVVDLGHKKELF
ncbi:N-acetylmuramoyl-L-alanine amidase [Amylibacter sp. SFDW26]|nr:N-acetylmuramoyl-L-alanine amidase [Amylibacter sp. SFDW26]KAB7610527.1 N-acetylmuramoyl-L-alanine amidase [Amylibacter sp. SFDW26]